MTGKVIAEDRSPVRILSINRPEVRDASPRPPGGGEAGAAAL